MSQLLPSTGDANYGPSVRVSDSLRLRNEKYSTNRQDLSASSASREFLYSLYCKGLSEDEQTFLVFHDILLFEIIASCNTLFCLITVNNIFMCIKKIKFS